MSVEPLWAALSLFELAIPWAISHLWGDYSLIVAQLHVQRKSNVSDDLQNFCASVCKYKIQQNLIILNFVLLVTKRDFCHGISNAIGGKVFYSTWWMGTPQERTLINLNWCRCQQLQPAVIKRVINLSIAMFFSNWLKVCLQTESQLTDWHTDNFRTELSHLAAGEGKLRTWCLTFANMNF